MKAKIHYYGVRGSTPTAGPQFTKFGGNTTCVMVETEKEKVIIDAGTGIRQLGLDLMAQGYGSGGKKLHLLFTHTHWDHIQGLPFFIPAYIPNNSLEIYGESKSIPIQDEKGKETKQTWDIERTLYMQQTFMYFPASTTNMAANFNYHTIKPNQTLEFDGFTVTTLGMKHPNNTLGFRFDFDFKKCFVFCTDIEHGDGMLDKVAEFAEGADGFAFDSQYTPAEYEDGKVGWGHSTYEKAAVISKRASVKEYHMIHHDPLHNDEFLEIMAKDAKKEFSKAIMIPEGFTFEL